MSTNSRIKITYILYQKTGTHLALDYFHTNAAILNYKNPCIYISHLFGPTPLDFYFPVINFLLNSYFLTLAYTDIHFSLILIAINLGICSAVQSIKAVDLSFDFCPTSLLQQDL